MSLVTIITMVSVVGSIYGGLAVMIGLALYPNNLKNRNLDCAKAPGLTDRKRQPSTEKEQETAYSSQEKVSRNTQEC